MILAHAFGVRYDLPLPLALFVAGGAATVLVSFALVVRRPVEAAPVEVATVGGSSSAARVWVEAALEAAGLVVVVGLILAGIAGSQVVAENILPVSFWLVVWIAVPLSCALAGDWTRYLNPFAALARLADRPTWRGRLLGGAGPLPWPERLGWWPAALLFFAGACGELVFNLTATVPHVLAYGLLIYGISNLMAGFLFGPTWLARGELFSVLFSTWGRIGYLRFGQQGRRGLGGGLTRGFDPSASRIGFVLLLLISINFDGLLATPSWAHLEADLPQSVTLDPVRLQLFRLACFAALALIVAAVFGLFAMWSARVGQHRRQGATALAGLLPSLLPIAFGYLLAHNLEYLIVNGQLLLPLAGNPAGLAHWPRLPYPFNDSYEVDVHVLPAAFYWYASMVVIVAAHVVAVVVAHRQLAPVGPDPGRVRLARRSEYPWLAAMVGYTMFSLWLIAQPIAR